MSTDIAGWVEIKCNNHWFGVIEVNTILDRNYYMFDLLFAGRNENFKHAIAPQRGIPEDRSYNIRQLFGEHYGKSDDTTWIGWEEIKSIDWELYPHYLTEDWQRLFRMIKILLEDSRVQDVRLIVWFF